MARTVTVGDKTYHLFLRFKREYKPYTIKLLDVRKDDYVASDTPRNYSSDIQLVDRGSGVDKPVHIKMNDPLRYAGETFYQSGYHPPAARRREATTLQVVHNRGWMIPYVACMIVAIGMVAHFLITVTRFVGRREAEEMAAGDVIRAEPAVELATRRPQGKASASKQSRSRLGLVEHSACRSWSAGIFAFYRRLGRSAAAGRSPARWTSPRFGQLPVAHLGRVKPLDTLARNTLRAISQSRDAEARGRQEDVRRRSGSWK